MKKIILTILLCVILIMSGLNILKNFLICVEN